MICISFILINFERNKLQGKYKFTTNFNGTAKVYLEDNGVPRFVADNELAAAYANGFYLASNRLWQMEYLRRLSQGRLSEIFGKAAVGLDENFRTLGLTQVCEKEVKLIDEEDTGFFNAYYAGINDYANTHSAPLQFWAFGITFQNWTINDSCTLWKLMSFMLSPDWGLEFSRDYVSAITEDEEFIQSLFSYSDKHFDDNTEFIINEEEHKEIGLYSKERQKHLKDFQKGDMKKYVEEVVDEIAEELKSVSFDGSNAWVVSGEHTKSGKPIIANDPHLGNGVPSIWFYSHTEYPDGSFISGTTVPGVPIYAIFVTDKIGK